MPQSKQQEVTSCADKCVWLPVSKQSLSLIASVAPKAQQLPQAAWSRTSWIVGQLAARLSVRQSNSSGMSMASRGLYCGHELASVLFHAPSQFLKSPMVAPTQGLPLVTGFDRNASSSRRPPHCAAPEAAATAGRVKMSFIV